MMGRAPVLCARWFRPDGATCAQPSDEALPDRSSLTTIPERDGLETVHFFFDVSVKQCRAAALVRGADLDIDATTGRTNASIDAVMPRFVVASRAHMDDLFAWIKRARTRRSHETEASRRLYNPSPTRIGELRA